MRKDKILKRAISELNNIRLWCEYYSRIAKDALENNEADLFHKGYGFVANSILDIVQKDIENLEKEREKELALATRRNYRIVIICVLISVFASFFSLMKAGM